MQQDREENLWSQGGTARFCQLLGCNASGAEAAADRSRCSAGDPTHLSSWSLGKTLRCPLEENARKKELPAASNGWIPRKVQPPDMRGTGPVAYRLRSGVGSSQGSSEKGVFTPTQSLARNLTPLLAYSVSLGTCCGGLSAGFLKRSCPFLGADYLMCLLIALSCFEHKEGRKILCNFVQVILGHLLPPMSHPSILCGTFFCTGDKVMNSGWRKKEFLESISCSDGIVWR